MSDSAFRVALTLDAEHPDRSRCPEGNADRILDVLAEREAPATFFIQGRWARSQPLTARRIADDGHLVGHHSTYHARMTLLSDPGLREDLRDGEETIREITGRDPRPWFRCPFGDGRDDPRVLRALGELGYRNVHWHVELQDWEPWREGDQIARDAVEGSVARGDGAVVLLHTWPGGSGDAVGPLVDGLRRAGAALVTIDDLEDLP